MNIGETGVSKWEKHVLTRARESSTQSCMPAQRPIVTDMCDPFLFCRSQSQWCGFSGPWPSCWASTQEHLTWWKHPQGWTLSLPFCPMWTPSLLTCQHHHASEIPPTSKAQLPKFIQLSPKEASVHLQPDTSSPVTNSKTVSKTHLSCHLGSCPHLP